MFVSPLAKLFASAGAYWLMIALPNFIPVRFGCVDGLST